MGGEQKTVTNTKSDPWAPAQPGLKTALSGALDAFKTTYQGPGVAAMDPNVTAGQNQAIGNANSGAMSNLAGSAINNVGNVLSDGGFAAGQQGAMSGIGGALGSFNSQMGQAQNYINPFASGAMRGSNPYLDAAIGNSMSEAADAVNRQFSASGRYGSGAHSGTLGKSLGNIATSARMNAYNTDTQNQLAAIGQMGNLSSAGLSGNLGGYGAMAGLGQQAFGNTLAGAGAIPGLNQAQNTDAQTLMQIGGQRMDYDQAKIDAANENPWTRVGNLAQIAGGIGGLGGTQNSTSTTSVSGGSPILGGILGGVGALGNLGKGLPGLASGFSSLFALSDARAKEDIKPVGMLTNGLRVYSYKYKGDTRPQIGLLAQEVEMRKPEAVATDPVTGLKAVRYDLATEAA
jgi:hypothetical protein